MVDKLKQNNSNVRYTEYTNEGHRIWNRAYEETELLQWLFMQRNSVMAPKYQPACNL